ncbi:histone acetyltransferase, MYST superfamily, partial [Coprinellus micaceus]
HDPELTGANRNIGLVYFGDWKIQTWFDSPYPLPDTRVGVEYAASVTNQQQCSNLPSLFVCEKCFEYDTEFVVWAQHQSSCTCDSPPGRKVYHRGDTRIWEIDGDENELYCQNVSLFGKFFLSVEPTSVDVQDYFFYVLVRAKDGKEDIIGFFSKEKAPRGEHNISWLVIFPQWQRSRYGTLMIEFSYELSRRVGKVGGPGRPLTSLGLRGYLSYWVATLVRFFR